MRNGYLAAAALTVLALAACKPAPSNTASAANAAAAAAPAPAPAPPATAWAPDAPNPNVTVALDPAPTQPGDVPDSHDVAFLKRFQGASMIGYVTRPYDKLSFFDSTGGAVDKDKRTLEGATTRIVYRVPVGHSALEVFRNYEDLVGSAGLARTSEIACAPGQQVSAVIFNQSPIGKLTGVFQLNSTFEAPFCYFTAQGVANGQSIPLGVSVAEKHGVLSATSADGKDMTYKDGEVVVLVDLLVAKPLQDHMVTVKAAEMADALASKGVVDLYGILFDTDRTEVKPDSAATLGEVASLMKIDRSLRLEVSGHTDNSGAADHNLKLSQGRADAVVAALVGQYGIDRSRLVAKGYGSGKPVAANDSPANMAKNRRVELRKI